MNVSEEAAASVVLDFLQACGCEAAAEALDAALGDTRHGVKPLHALQTHCSTPPGASVLLDMVRAVLARDTPSDRRRAAAVPQVAPACSSATASAVKSSSEAVQDAVAASERVGVAEGAGEAGDASEAAPASGGEGSSSDHAGVVAPEAAAAAAAGQGDSQPAAAAQNTEPQEAEATPSEAGYDSDSFDESSVEEEEAEGEVAEAETVAVAEEADAADASTSAPDAPPAPRPLPGATPYTQRIAAALSVPATVPDAEAVESAAAKAAAALAAASPLAPPLARALRRLVSGAAATPPTQPDPPALWSTCLQVDAAADAAATGRWRLFPSPAALTSLPPALQAVAAALQAEALQRLYYADPFIFDEEGGWGAAEWDVAPCAAPCAASPASSSCSHRPWVPSESEGTPLEPAPRQLQRAAVLAATQLVWRARPREDAPALAVLPPLPSSLSSSSDASFVDGATEACRLVVCSSRSELAAVVEASLPLLACGGAPGLLCLAYACLATATQGEEHDDEQTAALDAQAMLRLLANGSLGNTAGPKRPLAAWGLLLPPSSSSSPPPPPRLPVWVTCPATPAAPPSVLFAAPKGAFDEPDASAAVPAYRWDSGEACWGALSKLPAPAAAGLAARSTMEATTTGAAAPPPVALIVELTPQEGDGNDGEEEEDVPPIAAVLCGSPLPPPPTPSPRSASGPLSPSFSSSGRLASYSGFLAEASAAVTAAAAAAEPLKPAPRRIADALTAALRAVPRHVWSPSSSSKE